MDKHLAEIRLAQVADCESILAIYEPYVKDSAITFTSTVPTLDNVVKTLLDIKKRYPYLVCSVDDRVVGFAYGYMISPQEAYGWNVELAVYIDPKFQGRGIATALYSALIPILKTQGYNNIYVAITLPNNASVALHKHFGFKELAVHKANAYILDKWQDVLWMEYRIPGALDPKTHGLPKLLSKLNENDIKTTLALASAILNGAQ